MSEIQENQIITLSDESGAEHEFEVLELLEVEAKNYAVLREVGAEEEALILRLEKDAEGNDTILATIEDDEEFEKVAEAYDTILFEELGGKDADV